MARSRADNYRWRAYQDTAAPPDERDQQRTVLPVCTATRRAPRHQGEAWQHPDGKEVAHQGNRMTVVMNCPHCGHEWRTPR